MEFKPAQNSSMLIDDARKYKHDLGRIFYPTDFDFLKAHNGFRPGKVHLLISTAGAGKSTLTRGIIREFLKNNFSVFTWLSEEKPSEFMATLIDLDLTKEQLSNHRIYSEMNESDPTIFDDYISAMDHFSNTSGNPDLIVYDNVSTSSVYSDDCRVRQPKVAKMLKKLAHIKQCPMLIISHTGATQKNNQASLIPYEDVRGNKGLTNISEHVYVFQRFQGKNDNFFQLIRSGKSRDYTMDPSFYLLVFDGRLRTITNDSKIDQSWVDLFLKHNVKI